jgi:hypothetical protein
MISIIVCSVNPQLLSSFTKNVEDTIGVPFEIIAIDNRKDNDGICKVYNRGARLSNYNFLCFIHEDVLFHTIGWGLNLIQTFRENPSVGIIGACGAKCKSKVPSMWIDVPSEFYVSNAYFPEEVKARKETKSLNYEVAVLDGLFLATKKEIWNSIKFNEEIEGFHFYDIDISLQIGRLYKVMVSPNIIFEHISRGKRNKAWMEAAFKYHKKSKRLLPIFVGQFSNKEKRKVHFTCAYIFFKNLINFKASLWVILYYYILCIYYNPLSRIHISNIKVLIIYGFNKHKKAPNQVFKKGTLVL